MLWSVLALIGYFILDFVLSWLAANSGAMLQTSKDAGSTLGVGKEVGVAVDAVKNTGLIDQLLALLRLVLAPLAFIGWLLGVVAIVILPRLFGRFYGMYRSRRH